MKIPWLYKIKKNLKSLYFSILLSRKNFFFNNFSIHFLKCIDETFVKIRDEQIMRCNIKYYFYEPKGRIKDYLDTYKIPKQIYSISSNSILIGKELNGFDKKFKPIIESFPNKYFFTQNEKLKFKNIFINNPKINLDITVCPLF